MWVVWLVSAAVLGFEISLMRVLLVASWHHFAFLVISVVLLGFGASGTALFFARSWAVRHGEAVLFALALGTAAAMPITSALAQHVPIEARFVPTLLREQAAYWVLYWGLLTVPFFLGAAVVGLALMLAPRRAGTVYGANLIGSAAGALLAPLVMSIVPPAWLSLAMGGVAFVGAAGARPGPRWIRWGGLAACAVAVAATVWLDPPRVRIDPYKYQASLEHLAAQGSVERVARTFGPRAVVEAYRGEVLHDIPFLSVGLTPPAISVLTADGHLVGSVLDVASADEADIVDRTLMAVPFALARSEPRVALLGETGGVNVWLAARHQAAAIDVVQPDGNLLELMRGPLGGLGGAVLDARGVRATVAEPRHFIEHAADRFDLIQLASLQSTAAGSSGVGGLGEDHLVTVEGITACLRRLSADGMLAVCRGIQTPPRDNVKLLATIIEAARRAGHDTPARHLVVVRDFLAVCTIYKASPWRPVEIDRVRALCRKRELTPVWFPGVVANELNRPDALPESPAGGDWYYYAVKQLLSPGDDRFIDEWAFDIRPATDNRPFFLDFCRLKSIGALRRYYGDLWLTRAELAFLFVVAATVTVGLVGAAATILPLPLVRQGAMRRGRAATVAYFGCLGLGYLLLEMICLSRLTYLVGDAVRAAAVTICGFLFFSGLGSLTTQRVRHDQVKVLRRVVFALVFLGVAVVVALEHLALVVGPLPVWGRCVAALVAIAPLAYVMGFPMPMGLARLDRDGIMERRDPVPAVSGLIPWAWGTNGFASVLAAPLTLVVAMTWGYHVAAVLALVCYVAAAQIFALLPPAPGVPRPALG
ncbi:MAG: spermidine synthase family protein [Planctomycetota bacterium]